MEANNNTEGGKMKAVNVFLGGEVVATIPMENWLGLDDVMREWAGFEGAELRPAGGKVFGNARHHARGYIRKIGKWFTL